MKKKQLLFLSLILLASISIYMFMNRDIIATGQVESIHVMSTDAFMIDSVITPEDSEDLAFFADLINDRKLLKDSSSDSLALDTLPNCELTYELRSKSFHFDLYRNENKLYLEDDDHQLYTLKTDLNEAALVHPLLSSLYETYQAPMLQLSYQDQPVDLSSYESQWQFFKADQAWYTSHFPEVSNETMEPLKISEASQLFNYTLEPAPDHIQLQVFREKELCYEEMLENNTFSLYPEDGFETYILTATWDQNEESAYYGTASYAFKTFTDLPPSLDYTSQGTIGGYIKFTAKNVNTDETPYLNQKVLGSFQFFKVDREYVGYLPLSYYTKPGQYTLSFGVQKEDGSDSEPIEYTLDVQDRNFKIQYLTISTTTEKATRNDEAYSQFAKYFNPARESTIGEQLWEGAFIKPVEGRTSTTYGERRYVNNAPTSYRHSGMDIAISKGTPIQATNTGKVKLAMPLILTGNTIVIDHGLGVFSVYFHCNELFVEEGQMVTKGEKIATVGTTGFSTGPHLHWTMSIYDQNIDPEWIIGNDF